MKSLNSSLSWLVKGTAVIAGSLGALSFAAPSMANQATASGAYTLTTPAGYVESYSAEVVLPDGFYFNPAAPAAPADPLNSVMQVEFVSGATAADDPYLDLRTVSATAVPVGGVITGTFESAAAAALNAAVADTTGTVFGAEQLDAISAIIKSGTGVAGLK